MFMGCALYAGSNWKGDILAADVELEVQLWEKIWPLNGFKATYVKPQLHKKKR